MIKYRSAGMGGTQEHWKTKDHAVATAEAGRVMIGQLTFETS